MKVSNLNDAPLSDRNGSYGGAAGSKEGILIDGEYWIVKYPQSTRNMNGNLISYTTAPLSEFLGSHIYDILGYPVHETILGVRNNKLVVACKDFCFFPGELREMRTLKNTYNAQLETMLEEALSPTGSARYIDLNEILLHLDYNPILSQISGLKARFWDCILVDGLINNNDRNNGNWGLLYRNNAFQLAPIFDNGAAFSNKASEESLAARLSDPRKMEASALNTISIYGKNGKNLTFKNLLTECLQYPDFCEAIKRTVPLIQQRVPQIREFISQIPESYQGISVCSPVRKAVYLQDMELRLDKLLVPTLHRVVAQEIEHGKNQPQSYLDNLIATSQKRAEALNATNQLEYQEQREKDFSLDHE